VSVNPFLRRVLGEAVEEPPTPGDSAVPPRTEGEPTLDASDVDPDGIPDQPVAGENAPTIPVEELAQMWRSGQQMDVATELMFTPASYADLVDLAFLIGQGEGRKLGHMLDELADSENIPVPEPTTDYSSVLQRVANTHSDRDMLTPEI
jgi:hypothetical protein